MIKSTSGRPFGIAIHGGAGTISRSSMTEKKELAYKSTLKLAVTRGYNVLKKGGSALDAVEAAVVLLEDSPLFNAGKGAVFTSKGNNEMDAAIMDGKSLKAGAMAGVSNVKNPIVLAKTIMKQSKHVLLSGAGALEFARLYDLEIEDDDYFKTEMRYEQWQRALKTNKVVLDHAEETSLLDEKKFGTVGAVALDLKGNIAAATSTGGMTNKQYGRIGDSPLIGSGTYANNKTCAVSCTGHGEFFMRSVVAYDISCLMEYKGLSLQEASALVIKNKLKKLGGRGGCIAIDTAGNITMPFNCKGMYRAARSSNNMDIVAIF